MTKYFKIIVGNIRTDLLRNIIMVAFVGISVFLMNISLSRFMHQEYINSLVRDCGLYDNYIYSAPPDKEVYNSSDNEINLGDAALKYIRGQLSALKKEGKIDAFYASAFFNAPISNDINDRADYILYPKEFAVDVNFPVSSGEWFRTSLVDEEVIPVIIGGNLSARYRIGDKISFPFLEKDAKIIGVLERNAMVLTLGAGGNGMNLNETFRTGNNMIIACVDEIDKGDDMGGTVIKVAPQFQHEVFERISDVSYTFTFMELSERAYEDNKLLTEMQSVVFVLMIIVCITGVSSGNLLETITCKKRYAIYFLCGMNWSICMRITFVESLIKLIIPSALGYWGFLKWCSGQDFYALRITGVNIIITIVLLVVVFFLTSLKPLLDIKKTSPVRIISEI